MAYETAPRLPEEAGRCLPSVVAAVAAAVMLPAAVVAAGVGLAVVMVVAGGGLGVEIGRAHV